ncbi:alpha/beta hydrolase [Sphingomonas profundi]|uniref:alpha/beta hydrolase n=1 Tax=Alterirhizorhabdus profundi TaxID=2681549 RepID=UPI0012E8C189|nr:alpha/beta hydrolase [Sphingomonas profundi]
MAGAEDGTPAMRADVRALLDLLAAQDAPSFAAVGAAKARAGMAAMGALFDIPPEPIARDERLAIQRTDGGEIALRLFDHRPSRGPSPIMLFLHGGGFVIGDLETYAGACGVIARRLDLPVLSVDYRLAPEHPWPAGPDDCEAAARAVADLPGLGFAVTGLVLAGDSAGGCLAAVTAMALRDRPASVPVAAQWLLYPVTDLRAEAPSYAAFAEDHLLRREDMRWFLDCYGADRSHRRASPLAGPHHGMPPTLLVTAALDPLRDEGRAYAAALVSAGVPTLFVEAAGMVHGFLSMRRALPSADEDLSRCYALLRTMIGLPDSTTSGVSALPA